MSMASSEGEREKDIRTVIDEQQEHRPLADASTRAQTTGHRRGTCSTHVMASHTTQSPQSVNQSSKQALRHEARTRYPRGSRSE